MRAAAVILAILFLAAAGLTGYLYFQANVVVTGIDCVATDAEGQKELFAELRTEAENGSLNGTPFSVKGIGEAGDYQFYTYTVHLANETFVRAEVAEVQVTPMNGDVLQMAEAAPAAIPARGRGEIRATILTLKSMHNVREMMVTYYLWGLPFSARVTYSK